MGNTISPRAAADDIFADANTAYTRASARGGTWKALADQRIGPILALRASIEAQLEAARTVARPLLAVLDATDQRADDLLGKVSDDIWNAVGRPASDAALSVIFPGGYAYYAEGTVEGQPTRMELLARLLESNLHPKLAPEVAQAAAAEVRASAAELRQALDAVREPSTQVEILERVRTAIARNAGTELAHLKRSYKAAGFTEAEIHAVIPDRPRKTTSAKQPATAK